MAADHSELTRREVLRNLALALTAAGTGAFNLEAAKLVHAFTGEERAQSGAYTPKLFTAHEYRTITRLADLIVPADERGGSAVDAGAPEFIDLLCSQNEELAAIYTGGLAWLNAAMRRRHAATFADATADQQTGMLDALVEAEPDDVRSPTEEVGRGAGNLQPGVDFFSWVRRMTVDAYYTSPIGIRDVGYVGNTSLSRYATPRNAVAFVNRAADDLGL